MEQAIAKFRGVCKHSGLWVWGYYRYNIHQDTHHILSDDWCGFSHEVHPETIGQYTTIKDKDGIELYHGDIVKPMKNPKGNPFYYYRPYEITWQGHKWILLNRLGSQLSGGILINKSVGWEKIGDIHMTPKLLKSEIHE